MPLIDRHACASLSWQCTHTAPYAAHAATWLKLLRDAWWGRLSRSILADKPRVTRFPVEFDPVEAVPDMGGEGMRQEQGVKAEEQGMFALGDGNGHVMKEEQKMMFPEQQQGFGAATMAVGAMDMEA